MLAPITMRLAAILLFCGLVLAVSKPSPGYNVARRNMEGVNGSPLVVRAPKGGKGGGSSSGGDEEEETEDEDMNLSGDIGSSLGGDVDYEKCKDDQSGCACFPEGYVACEGHDRVCYDPELTGSDMICDSAAEIEKEMDKVTGGGSSAAASFDNPTFLMGLALGAAGLMTAM